MMAAGQRVRRSAVLPQCVIPVRMSRFARPSIAFWWQKCGEESILSRSKGAKQMGYALTLQQRPGYFIKCLVTIAVIFLAASACDPQAAPGGQAPGAAWAQELNKYPGLMAEIDQLV